MAYPTTPEQAKDVIGQHVIDHLNYQLPSPGSAHQILERPFPTIGSQSIREADAILYGDPVNAATTRRRILIEKLTAARNISLVLDASFWTTFGDEQLKEDIGGVDSALAIAVLVREEEAWITITNYHLYDKGPDGNVRVARYLGAKILGPGMIITRRPSSLSRNNHGAKHFPDSPLGSNSWHPVAGESVEVLEAMTGIDATLLARG